MGYVVTPQAAITKGNGMRMRSLNHLGPCNQVHLVLRNLVVVGGVCCNTASHFNEMQHVNMVNAPWRLEGGWRSVKGGAGKKLAMSNNEK